MNKAYLGAGLGVVGGLVLGFSLQRLFAAPEETKANAAAAAVASSRDVKLSEELARRAHLSVEKVERRPLSPTLDLVGSVDFDPDAVADVGGRIAGRITRVMVTVGDTVTKGQPVIEIESNELGEASAALLSARANLIAAEHHAARETALGQKQLSSAPVVESARASAKALQAETAGAEQRLLAMGLTPGEIQALATGKGPRNITLRAPIPGEVVERYAVLGQVVDPTQPILRIADLSQLWVELDLFERDLSKVQAGDAVEILSETYPGRVFTGKVSYINASIDTETRTAKVRIEVPNPERLLRPGQFVHAHIALRGSPEPVIGVPRKAVLQVEGETSVFVQTGKESYVVRPVELGHVAGDVIEIRRGLIEGESVVTEGGFVLKSELQR
ncbi:MAG TPA: efflux RND transporter periplasmic adaptor subunit [Polyangiales bacterium]